MAIGRALICWRAIRNDHLLGAGLCASLPSELGVGHNVGVRHVWSCFVCCLLLRSQCPCAHATSWPKVSGYPN